MNKKTLLILCVILAAVLVGASMLYSGLAGSVDAGGLATTPPQTQPEQTETQPPQVSTESTEPSPSETTAPTDAAEPDYSAPDFTMLDWDEKEVMLSQYFGKPIILNFWASWCGPCKMEMPDIQEFYDRYGQEIQFLIVNCTDGSRETVDTAREFIVSQGYTFPVYFDTTSMGAYTYGASSIPLTFFIDAAGNLQAYYMGAMSTEILQQGIDMIYAEKTPE